MYSPEFTKKFKVGRPLDPKEHATRLELDDRLRDYDPTQPNYELAVIQFSSTFVEITDRNYPLKGVATLVLLFVTFLSVAIMGELSFITLTSWSTSTDEDRYNNLISIAVLSPIFLPLLLFCIWFSCRESFTYTHLPIRLNRKNRMVYVWRRDGTVLTVPWDEVFFQLRSYPDMGGKTYDLVGHVLEADRVTVKESFAFSSYASSEAIDLRQHFEFFRRYMEDGPQEAWQALRICLPLARRRETWWEGFMRLLLNMHGAPIAQLLFSPFWFLVSLGRWIAMRTSKIPQWPQAVESECVIDPKDPYKRESGWEAERDTTGN